MESLDDKLFDRLLEFLDKIVSNRSRILFDDCIKAAEMRYQLDIENVRDCNLLSSKR